MNEKRLCFNRDVGRRNSEITSFFKKRRRSQNKINERDYSRVGQQGLAKRTR